MIGLIENAILARMKAAADANVLGYSYRQLESLPLDADPDLAKRVQGFPSGWVVYSGWDNVRDLGGGSSKVTMRFAVIVATRSLRNATAARQGAGEEVGSYQMAIDVAGLFMGQDLGLAIGRLQLGAMRPLTVRDELSIWAVAFTTDVEIDPLSPDLGKPSVGDFSDFHVNWDVRPFGAAPDSLPADAAADATSHITVPT